MRSRLLSFAGLGILAATFACTSSDEESAGAGAAHTEGAVVWNNDPHGWADVDRAAVEQLDLGAQAAPEDHVTTSRIQLWLDRYDAIVRAMLQESGNELAAPKPLARVIIKPEIHARVMALPTCIASAATPPPTPLPFGVSELTLMAGPRTSMSTSGFGVTCAAAKNWSAESGLAWFNALGGLQVVPGESVVDIMNGEREHAKAVTVAIRAAAPFVDVNAGMIAAIGERTMAVVLAHELAHYYRTHDTTLVDGKYDFWYDRATHTAERPTPVANASEYRDQYARLKLPRLLVPGQKFHPRMTETLLRWTRELVSVPGHVCEGARKDLLALPLEVRANLEPTSPDATPLDAKGRAALLALEPKIATCVDGVELTDAADPGRDAVFDSNKISRAWFTSRITTALATEIPAAELAAAQTLTQIVALLEAAAKRLDEQAPEFLKRLADNRIGHYTAEQEADDLSMELASRAGIRPGEVMESYIRLTHVLEAQDPALWMSRQGMSAKECHDLAKVSFRDGESERKVYVSMGSLEDPHHAWCYRLLNLQREREAHAYRNTPPQYAPQTTPWKDVQSAAKALLAPPAPPKPDAKPADPVDPAPSEPGSAEPAPPPTYDDSDWPSAGDGASTGDDGADEGLPTAGAPGKKASGGGCSSAPASSSGTFGWLLGIAAAIVTVRRRRR